MEPVPISRLGRTAALLVATLLSGCASTGGLHSIAVRIDPSSLRAQRSLAAVKLDSAAWPQPGWWQAAGDPQLDKLVDEALASNPGIALVQARVRAALALAGAVDAERKPTLNGGAVTYRGHVEGLGIGTGSAFSLLPAQNASGNWIKIVQRLPVRIVLDPAQVRQHPLRIGMSMDARVNLHDRSGPMLSRQPVTKPVFDTHVYARDVAGANAMIASIIRANAAGAARIAAAKGAAANPQASVDAHALR